jgi:hypothetical protein
VPADELLDHRVVVDDEDQRVLGYRRTRRDRDGQRAVGEHVSDPADPRQGDGELRAASERAGDRDVPAEQAAHLADDGQAEARAADPPRRRAVHLAELLEDERQIRRWDADAGVLDREDERARRADHRLDVDLAAIGELGGVGQEVEHQLPQLEPIGDDAGGAVAHAGCEEHVLALERLLDRGDALLDELPHVDRLLHHLHPARLDLRQVEDVVDERQEGARVRLDYVEVAPAVRGEPLPLLAQEEIAVTEDPVQRGADLVGEVGEELALEARRRLDLLGPLLLHPLGDGQLGGEAIEVVVLLPDHFHLQGALLVAGDGARGDGGAHGELLLERSVLRRELLDPPRQLRFGDRGNAVGRIAHAAPKTREVKVVLMLNPQ